MDATLKYGENHVVQDDANLVQLMQRFGRTDLGAEDLDDSDLEKFLNGEHLSEVYLTTLSFPYRPYSAIASFVLGSENSRADRSIIPPS